MQHFVLHQFTDIDLDQAIREVNQLALARYDNPFEQKDFLQDKTAIQDKPALHYALMELRQTTRTAAQLLDLSIAYTDWQHYGGLFVYRSGDFLQPHVDAGIHPKTGERKVATICLYLTDAILSFWQGDQCTKANPEVWLEHSVWLKAGEAILFPNHDWAWHSVPIVQPTTSQRVCLTLSYMAYSAFHDPRYQNQRTRAYFARKHGTQDTPEVAELRRKRASEEHHQEVYRTKTSD